MQTRDKSIRIALITSVATIAAALIMAFGPSWWRPGPKPDGHFVIAGTVVDSASNRAIPQATVSTSGRTEKYITEDNGNFRLEIRGLSEGERVRIHVTKDGYRPYDEAVSPPSENLIVMLKIQ
jgi:Carboxypeptidase regulatory-like domain